MMRKFLSGFVVFVSVFLLARPPFGTANISVGYTAQKTCFSIRYQSEESAYKITSMFVLPGEEVQMTVDAAGNPSNFLIEGSAVSWTTVADKKWKLKAPSKPGLYTAKITEVLSGESMDLNVFVMVPYSKLQGGKLRGYKIGTYPKVPSSKGKAYALPRGFIEVTKENRNTLISPHFKLGQFLCKQQGSAYPKYVVLRERLIIKLEHMLEHVNNEGIAARTFSVMSGYRTPAYNKGLGNVKLSRHMWGDAADVYINNNNPGGLGMEDLNGDGKQDSRDAELLWKVMGKFQEKPSFKSFKGGLGWYKPTKSHGPFVHVDARGTSAKWSSN